MLSIDRRFIPKLTCGNILRPHSHSRNLFQLATQSQNLLLSGCYVDISIVHGSSQKRTDDEHKSSCAGGRHNMPPPRASGDSEQWHIYCWDMIEVYKILTGKYDPTLPSILHSNTNSTTRGNPLKLCTYRPKYDLCKYNFTVRVISRWNSLPTHVITADSVDSFKNRLDKFWANEEARFHDQW